MWVLVIEKDSTDVLTPKFDLERRIRSALGGG